MKLIRTIKLPRTLRDFYEQSIIVEQSGELGIILTHNGNLAAPTKYKGFNIYYDRGEFLLEAIKNQGEPDYYSQYLDPIEKSFLVERQKTRVVHLRSMQKMIQDILMIRN